MASERPRGGADVHDPQAASVSLAGFQRATRGSLTCAQHGLDRVPPDRGRWQRESGSGSSECSHSSEAPTTGRSSAWPAESDAALTSGTAKPLEPRGHGPALGRSSASQWGLSSTKPSAVSSARLPYAAPGMADDRALQTEVCVVGAGPAGLVSALLLQQSEIPCIVLERLSQDAFRRRAGAGLIEHRTVQLLKLARAGGADPAARRHGQRLRVPVGATVVRARLRCVDRGPG